MPALLHSAVFILSALALFLCILHIIKKPDFPIWPCVLLVIVAVIVAAIPA